jgi:hypothetical protein
MSTLLQDNLPYSLDSRALPPGRRVFQHDSEGEPKVPESRSRRKKNQTYVAPPVSKAPRLSPSWWAPVMVAVMLLGLVWVVVYYLWQGQAPIPQLGAWNLAIGFGLVLAGFGMTAGWR